MVLSAGRRAYRSRRRYRSRFNKRQRKREQRALALALEHGSVSVVSDTESGGFKLSRGAFGTPVALSLQSCSWCHGSFDGSEAATPCTMCGEIMCPTCWSIDKTCKVCWFLNSKQTNVLDGVPDARVVPSGSHCTSCRCSNCTRHPINKERDRLKHQRALRMQQLALSLSYKS
jgi:hypothetical protein